MSARSVLALMYTLDLLKERGVDGAGVLQRHGLDINALDPNSEIGRDRELAILAELLPRAEDPALGLEMGTRFGLAGYGPLTMLLMTCKNVFEGFQLGIRYQALTYLFGELSITPGAQHTTLVITPIPLPDSVHSILMERDMVGTFRLVNDIQTQLGLKLGPEEVGLPYPRPDHYQQLEDYFQCPVRFDQPHCYALIDNHTLAQEMPGYNKMAQDMYRAQCDAMLAQRQTPLDNLPARLTAYLQLFVRHFPNTAQSAQAFGVTERTFRRHLHQEGTTFQQLLDQVRCQKACRYLQHSDYSIAAIADLLGYSESAALVRAFERWKGVTPARFRRQQQGDG